MFLRTVTNTYDNVAQYPGWVILCLRKVSSSFLLNRCSVSLSVRRHKRTTAVGLRHGVTSRPVVTYSREWFISLSAVPSPGFCVCAHKWVGMFLCDGIYTSLCQVWPILKWGMQPAVRERERWSKTEDKWERRKKQKKDTCSPVRNAQNPFISFIK